MNIINLECLGFDQHSKYYQLVVCVIIKNLSIFVKKKLKHTTELHMSL